MKKYALKHPLKIGEKTTLDSLTLRGYVIASDYLAFDQRGGVAQRIALIASVAGADEAVIGKLHGADYVALERMVDALLKDAEVEAIGEEPKTSTDGLPLSDTQKK